MRTPRTALARGIVYSSESRKTEGIVGDLTVRENIVLGLQADRGWLRRVSRRKSDEVVEPLHRGARHPPGQPRARSPATCPAATSRRCCSRAGSPPHPKLLLLDEPTRGIDVGAKAEIQKLVADLAAQGMAVVFISAELEEVLRLSHRIAVLRDRRKVAEITNSDDVTTDDVVHLIASGGQS